MNPDDLDVEAYIAAAAPLAGLRIDPAYREEVFRQFALLARAASLVTGADAETRKRESAAVFTPDVRT